MNRGEDDLQRFNPTAVPEDWQGKNFCSTLYDSEFDPGWLGAKLRADLGMLLSRVGFAAFFWSVLGPVGIHRHLPAVIDVEPLAIGKDELEAVGLVVNPSRQRKLSMPVRPVSSMNLGPPGPVAALAGLVGISSPVDGRPLGIFFLL